MTIEAFILSWTGVHQNSLAIARALACHVDCLTLVYSDRDTGFALETDYPAIRMPDACFFAGKFKACLDACTADVMLVITGDVSCNDWAQLADKCRADFGSFDRLGLWAPLIDHSSWKLAQTCLERLADSSLCKVAQTDSIVFAMSRPVMTRMKRFDYRSNTYGWGIDWAAVACCYANGLFAAVDESILVDHPRQTAYEESACIVQMHEFLRQLEQGELRAYLKLQTRLRSSTDPLPPGAEIPPWCSLTGD